MIKRLESQQKRCSFLRSVRPQTRSFLIDHNEAPQKTVKKTKTLHVFHSDLNWHVISWFYWPRWLSDDPKELSQNQNMHPQISGNKFSVFCSNARSCLVYPLTNMKVFLAIAFKQWSQALHSNVLPQIRGNVAYLLLAEIDLFTNILRLKVSW